MTRIRVVEFNRATKFGDSSRNVPLLIEASTLPETQLQRRGSASNDEVERRAESLPTNEADLSTLWIPSDDQTKTSPRGPLEPIVRVLINHGPVPTQKQSLQERWRAEAQQPPRLKIANRTLLCY